MEERSKGLIISGIILLAIGLVASFYAQRKYPNSLNEEMTYPYQSIGILLDVAGIIFVALGLLYDRSMDEARKTLPPPSSPQQPMPQ